jgi:hypothetical protein
MCARLLPDEIFADRCRQYCRGEAERWILALMLTIPTDLEAAPRPIFSGFGGFAPDAIMRYHPPTRYPVDRVTFALRRVWVKCRATEAEDNGNDDDKENIVDGLQVALHRSPTDGAWSATLKFIPVTVMVPFPLEDAAHFLAHYFGASDRLLISFSDYPAQPDFGDELYDPEIVHLLPRESERVWPLPVRRSGFSVANPVPVNERAPVACEPLLKAVRHLIAFAAARD